MNISPSRKIAFGIAAGIFVWAGYKVLPLDRSEPSAEPPAIAAEQSVRPSAQLVIDAAGARAVESSSHMRAEAQPLVNSEEIAILGQFMRVRELREQGEGFEPGPIRNLEFVFRPGIRPRRLFGDREQLILSYRQLHRNNVGYGAATQFFLYQVVSRDSDGDGLLTPRDKLEVAVSRPDGSGYRVLDRDLQAVFGVEHLPAENMLRLEVEKLGVVVSRNYSLPSG